MDTERDPDYILDQIRTNFDFLFARGFNLIDVTRQKYHVFWVVLEGECRIRIGSDRDGEIYLQVAKRGTPIEDKGWFILEVLVYFLSNKQAYMEGFFGDFKEKDAQLLRLSKFLLTYLDKIIDLFNSDQFDKYALELMELRRTVDQLGYEEYLKRNNRFEDLERFRKTKGRHSG